MVGDDATPRIRPTDAVRFAEALSTIVCCNKIELQTQVFGEESEGLQPGATLEELVDFLKPAAQEWVSMDNESFDNAVRRAVPPPETGEVPPLTDHELLMSRNMRPLTGDEPARITEYRAALERDNPLAHLLRIVNHIAKHKKLPEPGDVGEFFWEPIDYKTEIERAYNCLSFLLEEARMYVDNPGDTNFEKDLIAGSMGVPPGGLSGEQRLRRGAALRRRGTSADVQHAFTEERQSDQGNLAVLEQVTQAVKNLGEAVGIRFTERGR